MTITGNNIQQKKQKSMMIQKLFFYFICLAWSVRGQLVVSECPSQWQLSNLIQTKKILQITSPADQINETFTEPFGASYFDSKPQAILSISDYDCEAFENLNFSITAITNNTNLVISFIAQNMKWTEARVIIWLTARPDMVVGYIDSANFIDGNIKQEVITINTTFPVKFHNDSRTWYLNYINGIRARTNNGAFSVNTSAFSKTQNTYSIQIVSGNSTELQKVELYYVVFNLQISLFSSGGGYESELELSSPIYKKVHKNFIPINYRLLGFDKITISSNNQLNLNINIDLDYILEIESKTGVEFIRIVYLTIGQKTSKVCEECGNFIFREMCIDNCPDYSYPYMKYINGGKSCLTCSSKINEEINEERNGCKCIEGFNRNNIGQCMIMKNEEKCGENKTLENGACVCDDSSIALDGGICFKCVPGSFKSGDTCVPCIRNCLNCKDAESCEQCIDGFTFDENAKACLDSTLVTPPPVDCGDNKTLENGACVCDDSSIALDGGICFKCVPGSFKSGDTCVPCIRNCLNCKDAESCEQCIDGFTFDENAKACLDSTLVTPPPVDCGDNKTLENGACVCDDSSIALDGGICFKCVPGSFKSGDTCVPCIRNCLNCKDAESCEQCIDGFTFDENAKACLDSTLVTPPPVDCGDNKTLENGACVCDDSSIALDGGICFKCVPGSFKSGDTCVPCIRNCLNCKDAESCEQCIDGFTFDENAKACLDSTLVTPPPVDCGDNKTLENGACVCDDSSIALDGGICFKCVPGSFKSGDTCVPCIRNCLNCKDAESCEQCIDGFTFDENAKACLDSTLVTPPPVDCGDNKTLENGACVCDDSSIALDGGICFKCVPGSFKSGDTCVPCIRNCLNCKDAESCEQCIDGFTFDENAKACLDSTLVTPPPVDCGDNKTLENGACVCDDSSIALDGGICFKCVPGSFKSGDTCVPCIRNCLNCKDAESCEQCIDGFTFDENAKACLDSTLVTPPPVDCGDNKTLENGACVCDDSSIALDGGICFKCVPGSFKSGDTCVPCIRNCLNCKDAESCEQCIDGFTFDENAKACLDSTLVTPPPVDCGDNKTLENGACVCDDSSIALDGGICFKCVPGSFKSGDTCVPCIRNCLNCKDAESCEQCIDGFTFDENAKACLDSTLVTPPPVDCGDNKTLENGACVCDDSSIALDGGICFKCVPGSFKSGDTCVPCIRNCLNCKDAESCEQCIDGFTFDENAKACLDSTLVTPPPVDCGDNKTLENGACVCDDSSIALDGGICFKCVPGSFKSGDTCVPCIRNCLNCKDAESCEQCIDGFTFDENAKACLDSTLVTPPPVDCGDNKTLENGACVCDDSSIALDGGICFKCVPGSFKSGDTCVPCIRNCLNCKDAESCEQCIDGFTFDENAKACLDSTLVTPPPVDCGDNKTLENGVCRCSQSFYQSNGICFPCFQNCLACESSSICLQCASNHTLSATKDSCSQATNSLVDPDQELIFCPDFCVLCKTSTSCQQCLPPRTFDTQNNFCRLITSRCGDEQISWDQECDDGNTFDEDGCSSTCQIEEGFDCPVGGICKYSVLYMKSSKILSNGIYTELNSTDPFTELDLQSFKYEFSDPALMPIITKIFSPQPAIIKVIHEYSLLPPKVVTVVYDFKGKKITVDYDLKKRKVNHSNNSIKIKDEELV